MQVSGVVWRLSPPRVLDTQTGYTKTCKLSAELVAVMGQPRMASHEVVKRVWKLIKEQDLHDPRNHQFDICNDVTRFLQSDSDDELCPFGQVDEINVWKYLQVSGGSVLFE